MQSWDAEDVISLRYRLGLSQSELARKLKLELETIASWEDGFSCPDKKTQWNLQQLAAAAKACSSHVSTVAVAEAVMKDKALNQVTVSQLKSLLSDKSKT